MRIMGPPLQTKILDDLLVKDSPDELPNLSLTKRSCLL